MGRPRRCPKCRHRWASKSGITDLFWTPDYKKLDDGVYQCDRCGYVHDSNAGRGHVSFEDIT